jgi:hypothetical protein
VTRKVRDESETSFWYDSCVGETPLCDKFGRLFDLAINKSCMVAEMFSLGWGAGGAAWIWRR